MPTTNKAGRQTLTGKNGVTLERKYLYLQPETWIALNELVQSSQMNQSTIIETLIASFGKELTKNDTIS